MALTDTAVRAAKPREKPYKLTDGKGLVLIVTPKGGRWWRFRYRLGGKEQMLSLGTYPDTTLAGARELRDDARKLVAAKRNPAAVRQKERDARANTFAAIANEWLSKQKKLAATTHTKAVWLFDKILFPLLGSKPISEITTAEVLLALKRIEATGKGETTHRAKWRAAEVFKYAIKKALATHNPVANLERGDLEPIKVNHHPAITAPKDVGALLRAIDGFTGQPSTGYALRLAPLVFVRPGELRAAEWEEFDLDAAEWRIPAKRMKMKVEHLVPLCLQAVAILRELQTISTGRLLFPGLRSASLPISENTMNAALRRLGYSKAEMTAHGFRTMASTLLNEQGFAPDLIELQLAHKDGNRVRDAYNRSKRLDERRRMMTAWANYLDGLRAGGSVIAIHRKKAP